MTRPPRSRCSPTRQRVLLGQGAEPDLEIRAAADPGMVLSARSDQLRRRCRRDPIRARRRHRPRHAWSRAAQPDAGFADPGTSRENPLALRQWTVIDQQGKPPRSSPVRRCNSGWRSIPKLFQYQYAVRRIEPLGTINKSETDVRTQSSVHWHPVAAFAHQRARVSHRQRPLSERRHRGGRMPAGADPGDRPADRLQRAARPARRPVAHRQPLECRAAAITAGRRAGRARCTIPTATRRHCR